MPTRHFPCVNRPTGLLPVLLAFVLSVPLAGQAGTPPEDKGVATATVDADYRREAVEWITRKLDEVYVFPETASKMGVFLHRQLEDGAYDNAADVPALVDLLTRDLQSISHDKHLRVVFDPNPRLSEDASDEEKENQRAEQLKQARARNFNFKQVEILQGNVGYLRFDSFMDATYAGDTAVAAMRFLGNCDALIIDLRNNGGGSPSMIQLITSYFFDEPKHLNSFYIRKSDSTEQFWTPAHVEGLRMSDVDLYVLTSQWTFSAAEEFTYNLKNMKRATIVGETTGGGAHPVQFEKEDALKIGMALPFGRAVNPITGTNWEGTGVEPDVQVPADSARDKAYLIALEKLQQKASGQRQVEMKWLTEYQKAVLTPQTLTGGQIDEYVGKYGPRTITSEEGKLYYQRENRPRGVLYPVDTDLFALEGAEFFRIHFVRGDGERVIAIRGLYVDGNEDRSDRDPE